MTDKQPMTQEDMFRDKYGLPPSKPPIDWTKHAAIILGLILIAIGTYLSSTSH